MRLNKKYICVFLILALTGCVTSPLTQDEESVRQIYSEAPGCARLGEVTEQNWWDGSFRDVKNRIKKSAKALGGNAFMIQEVSGQRRITKTFVYACK